MKRRLEKEKGRTRKSSGSMTFLSTLAHHLRKWLAPKRLLEVSQAGRQAGRQRQSDRRQSESSSSHPLAVLPVCLPARKRAVNYARQSKCIHVRLLNVIYNQPPTTLLHFPTFSFHLPFILVIIHWHSCHSMRMRMRIRIVALLARLDLVQGRTQPAKSCAKICLPDCLAIIIITIIMRIRIIIIREGAWQL